MVRAEALSSRLLLGAVRVGSKRLFVSEVKSSFTVHLTPDVQRQSLVIFGSQSRYYRAKAGTLNYSSTKGSVIDLEARV